MNAFRILLDHEMRRHRRALAKAAASAVVVAIATVALLGLSGWFITAAAGAGLAGPAVARAFNYLLPSATIRLLAILRTGARYGERLASHGAAFAVIADIRPALYRAITVAPPVQALALTGGEASARLVQDVAAIEGAIARRSARWGAVAAIMGCAALMTLAGAVAGACAVVVAAVLLLAGAVRLLGGMGAAGRAIQQANGHLRDALETQFSAATELRCYGMEGAAMAELDRLGETLAVARQQQALVLGRVEAACAAMAALATAGIFVLTLSAGVAIAALCALSAAMMIEGLAPLLRDWAEKGATEEATRRLARLFDAPVQPAPLCPTGPSMLRLPGMVALRPTGSCIAIMGPSGAGKTSLIEELLGLREIRAGTIFLDGCDIAQLPPAALRRHFAWLPQDARLLAGTVRENLLLAAPEADEAALWAALDDAALADRVRLLPHGLDSWIGEDGACLSGGERRLLALARAYLSPAPWLLLDEPTESLDPATEAQVVERLCCRLARTGQGMIVVSHRPAILALCDHRCEVVPQGPDRLPAAAA